MATPGAGAANPTYMLRQGSGETVRSYDDLIIKMQLRAPWACASTDAAEQDRSSVPCRACMQCCSGNSGATQEPTSKQQTESIHSLVVQQALLAHGPAAQQVMPPQQTSPSVQHALRH